MIVRDQVRFYTGVCKAHHAGELRRVMLSVNTLEGRVSDFAPPGLDWLLDSGAFTRIVSGRGHMSVSKYAQAVRRWSQVGYLSAAVAQDWMCEEFVLNITGMTVAQHQELTTRNYLALLDAVGGQPYVMPVIQGYAPAEYAAHCDALSQHLPQGALVGVGSVCKRNSRPAEVSAVLSAILGVRPDLRLHAFGLKLTALRRMDIATMIYSADSMAWSYDGRRKGGNLNHSTEYARLWTERVENLPLVSNQMTLQIA